MERIRELVNDYLLHLGFVILYQEELVAVLDLLNAGRKVDAIKCLREHAALSYTEDYVLRDESAFAAWLKANDKACYEKKTRVGLKEAKDIVDFIQDNMACA